MKLNEVQKALFHIAVAVLVLLSQGPYLPSWIQVQTDPTFCNKMLHFAPTGVQYYCLLNNGPVQIGLKLHSHHEIISTMGKTWQDVRWKQKPCRKVSIHISNKSASNMLKNVSMASSKLLSLNGISFSSKSCKLKTFPLSIASVLTLVVMGLGHEASK